MKTMSTDLEWLCTYNSGAPDSFKGPIALDCLHRDIDINDMF